MVPSAMVMLAKLPLNANGKIDRQALPAPEQAQTKTYVAPRTPTEEVLANIWAEVLRLPRVGTEDDFFQIGGHSLLATQVISRVRRTLNIELPLRTFSRNRRLRHWRPKSKESDAARQNLSRKSFASREISRYLFPLHNSGFGCSINWSRTTRCTTFRARCE